MAVETHVAIAMFEDDQHALAAKVVCKYHAPAVDGLDRLAFIGANRDPRPGDAVGTALAKGIGAASLGGPLHTPALLGKGRLVAGVDQGGDCSAYFIHQSLEAAAVTV